MKSSIVYLLHRFPRATDTFIFREIRALETCGLNVKVVSVWKPKDGETLPPLLNEWSKQTTFLLPAGPTKVAWRIATVVCQQPLRFLSALLLSARMRRPGLKGLVFQLFYLGEALLAAYDLRAENKFQLHNHFGDQSGMVTMLLAHLRGLPYSISFHGPHVFFDPFGNRIKEKAREAAFNRCISFYCRSQLMLFTGDYDQTRNEVVRCGLDLANYFYKDPQSKVATIISVARIAPEKGFNFLLDALKQVFEQYADVRLKIIGDGPVRGALHGQALDLGISDRVQFVGQMTETEIIAELGQSDLFVLPSVAEGLPVSVMEAMAVGVPVVATNIAALGELVEDGLSGRLVPPTDAISLAATICELIENHELRLSMARRGRKKIESDFRIEPEARKLAGLFARVPVR
jgi:glycosyltransferase involved in cell wall biosynthesis